MSVIYSSSSTDFSAIDPLIYELDKVKKDHYTDCIAKIRQIATALSTFTSASPSLKGRIQYLGKYLSTFLKLNSSVETKDERFSDNRNCVLNIIRILAEYKNHLQTEAVFYGSVSPTLDLYYQISQIEEFNELFTEMPFLFQNIQFNKTKLNFCINITPFNSYFDKLDLDALSESFDTTIIHIFKSYEIVDDQLLVPLDQLPPIEALQTYLSSSDLYCKLLAQMFLFCHIEKDNIYQNYTCQTSCIDTLKCIERYYFDTHLTKKSFIPQLGYLIEQIRTLQKKKEDSFHLLFNKKVLEEDHIKKMNWLEESASCFELILKIDSRLFKMLSLDPFIFINKEIKKSLDDFLPIMIQQYHKVKEHFPYPLPYPISKDQLFATSKEEFMRLPLFNYLETLNKKMEEHTLKKEEKALKKKTPRKKSPLLKEEKTPRFTAIGGAGTAIEDTSDPVEEKLCEIFVKKSPHKPSTPPPSVCLEASLVESYKQLAKLRYHERVNVWQRSPKEGLAYYGFGKDGITDDLSEEEMILRHYLPKDLLVLALNPHFGVKKAIILKTGEMIENHFESCLLINGKKYILEVSINAKGLLFHFYARRVTSMASYQNRGLTYSISEACLIQSLAQESIIVDDTGKEFDHIDGKTLLFDEKGNAKVSFAGNTFTVLKLLKPF